MAERIINSSIKAPGSYTITTSNGTISSSPTLYTFDNDISHGNINNSTSRMTELQKAEQITLNHNLSVGGTSQTMANGVWEDVGSQELQIGHAAIGATSTNDELFALISQYPDRDDGEPIYILPDMAECIDEAMQVTSRMKAVELPTIKRPSDIALWIGAWAAKMGEQITSNKQEQMAVAAQIYKKKLDIQIKTQEDYLVEKYGREMYDLYFKLNVEAGAVYQKDYIPLSITKKDVLQAAIVDGKAEKRLAYQAKLG